MSEQSVNTFTELNTDSHPVNTKPNVMTDAINATLTTKGKNQLILQNMNGNEHVASLTEGFQPLGMRVFKGINYIISGKFDSEGNFEEGEIGTFPSPDWDNLYNTAPNGVVDAEYYLPVVQKYSPLKNFNSSSNGVGSAQDAILSDDINYREDFRTDKLDFLSNRFIEVEVQPSYDNSVNIIFTDDYNPVRLINSRFRLSNDGKTAAIAERRQIKDTNTYAASRFGATKLLRQSDKIVDLQYNGTSYGGTVKGGGYRFYFKYVDSDGSLTDIIEESRLVSIAYDDHGATDVENTGKTISFTLNNIDQKFSGVRVYFSRATGTTAATTVIKEITNIYDLPTAGDSMDIVIYGSETTKDITYATLNLDYSSVDTVKSLSQHDDRLVLGNITNTTESYDILREISQRLQVTEGETDMAIKKVEEGYTDPSNVYYKLGYWAGETYEVGIVYILNEGRGVTPVFPIRGGDNYEAGWNTVGPQDFGYTGTGLISTVDGFINNSTENRLGVYRTSKRKVLLKGANQDTTQVRSLKVDVQELTTNPIIQAQTDGFFFVRRERKKDALVQGYMCNTAAIPIKNDLKASPDSKQELRTGIGVNKYDTLKPFKGDVKILPAPGRWTEGSQIKPQSSALFANGLPQANALDPISVQGIVFPDPLKDSTPDGNLPMFYSFYTPDALVDKGLLSSLFNGSNKGLVANSTGGDTVVGHQDTVDHTVVNTGGTNPVGYPITYQMSLPQPWTQNLDIHTCTTGTVTTGQAACGTWTEPAFATGNDRAFTLEDPFSGIEGTVNGNIPLNMSGTYHSKDSGWVPGTTTHYQLPAFNNVAIPISFDSFINVGLTLDSTGNLVAGTGRVSGEAFDATAPEATLATPMSWFDASTKLYVYDQPPIQPNSNWNNVQLGEVISASFTPINTVTQGNTGTFTIRVKLPVYRKTDTLNNTPGTLLYTETLQITGNYFMDNVLFDLNNNAYNISVTSDKPIQDIYIDNNVFNPEPIELDPGESIVANFIPEGQDSFSDGQFAAKTDRNIYYTINGTQDSNGIDVPITVHPDGTETTNTNTQLGVVGNQIRYSDYIGIQMSKGDPKYMDPLKNDPIHVRNYLSNTGNGYGLTGSDLGDWTYRVDDEGFRLGVVSNIYEAPNGVLRTEDWKNKYANTAYIDPYYAITKRFKWSDLTANNVIELFDGDCFVNYSYKRLNYALGIEGAPEATNPLDYDLLLRDGLADKGTVMPLVCESNYNTSLRTFEFKDGTEKALYGKNRTFFPIDTVEQFRGTRQFESSGYNHGYNYAFSDRNYVALNDRAPSLNIQYGNRIMVSESAIAGNFSNGYTDFSGLNFRDYNKQLGEITRLIAHNNTLFCIFEKGIGTVPMNQRTMMGGEQNGIFIDDAKVLATRMKVISTEYGSNQQFSVIKTDEYVYGCDLNKSKIWRIISQGPEQHSVELISDFAVQVILNDSKDRMDTNSNRNVVKANYDRERNNVIFSFLNEEKGNYTTDLYKTVSQSVNPSPLGNNVSSKTSDGDTTVESSLTDRQVRVNNALERKAVVSDNALTLVKETANPIDDQLTLNDDGRVIVDGIPVDPVVDDRTNQLLPVLIEKNLIGSLYFNETVSKWISRLSWNPLFTFNISNKLYSYNALEDTGNIWEHFSENVPYCNFYGNQDKFEFEFILVDNSSAQKILNNLHFICNRTFPGHITYSIDPDVDYETFGVSDSSYTDYMRQRTELVTWPVNQTVIGTTLHVDFEISQTEAKRIVGSHFVYNNNFYIIGNAVTLNGINYVTILDDTGNPLAGVINGLTINSLDYGIIHQNMEYREDHLYVEVGKGTSKSRVRDKAIKIRIVYEGYDYVTVQSIISKFVYSFN